MIRAWTFAVASLVFIAACGGGGATTSAPPASNSGSAAAPAAPAATVPAQAVNRCPLNAEQVTAAIGQPMQGPDSVCGFEPVTGKLMPHVIYVHQVSFACNGTIPTDAGFKEKVDGLSVTTYVMQAADGTRLLFCRANSPFEITVDMMDNAKARTVATTLAKQVLGGS